jgi:hypothetical protein
MRLEKGSEFKVQGSMETAAIAGQSTGEPASGQPSPFKKNNQHLT